jgi:adenine-specific DNA-methyltransferase
VTSFQTGFSSMLEVGFTTEGTREIQSLFGEKIIQFPKPVSLLRTLIQQGTHNSEDHIVLDFFAGSCTTAQAVMGLNHENNCNRRFIMVQLPEPISKVKVLADGTTFCNIADIGRERIRRVIARMQAEDEGKLDLHPDEDLGFKCYRLARSSFKAWRDYQGEDVAEVETLFDRFESPLVEGWQPQDLLIEIMLLQGFPLDSRVRPLPAFQQNQVLHVSSDFCAHALYVCLDPQLHDATVQTLELSDEDVLVCLDSALSDEAKLRLSDQCNLKVI